MPAPDNPWETPVHVERMELRLRMDATITIHDDLGRATDWLKPGTEAAVFWNGVPTQEELILRYNDLTEVTKALLQDVIESARKRLDAARRGGR